MTESLDAVRAVGEPEEEAPTGPKADMHIAQALSLSAFIAGRAPAPEITSDHVLVHRLSIALQTAQPLEIALQSFFASLPLQEISVKLEAFLRLDPAHTIPTKTAIHALLDAISQKVGEPQEDKDVCRSLLCTLLGYQYALPMYYTRDARKKIAGIVERIYLHNFSFNEQFLSLEQVITLWPVAMRADDWDASVATRLVAFLGTDHRQLLDDTDIAANAFLLQLGLSLSLTHNRELWLALPQELQRKTCTQYLMSMQPNRNNTLFGAMFMQNSLLFAHLYEMLCTASATGTLSQSNLVATLRTVQYGKDLFENMKLYMINQAMTRKDPVIGALKPGKDIVNTLETTLRLQGIIFAREARLIG